jgi:para-aminobenzoate synthetase component 1
MNYHNSIILTRSQIIDKINHFSGLGESFLFVIDFDGENGFVLSPEEATAKGLRYDIEGQKNDKKNIVNDTFQFDLFPVLFETYKNAFEKVVFHLKRGDSYLLNLTFPTALQSNLSLSEIYNISNAPFKLLVPDYFVVFSPEVFIRIKDAQVYSYPMKGTIDAELIGAEQLLLADKKEFFEHNTIVDLIRNDLSMISTNVKVSRFRYIDHIHTNRGNLLQMSSEIHGDLPDDYIKHLGEILFTLLPAGSVTGAPKEKTVEIIRKVERFTRGFYTGIFGYFDGDSLVSAVSIRFIEKTGTGLVFKSGGGITAKSKLKDEYNEMLKKVYVPIV